MQLRDGSERDFGGQKRTYTYRFERTCMRLIGMDQLDFPSCKGEGCGGEGYSANYLTGKAKRWAWSSSQRVRVGKVDAPPQRCLGDQFSDSN